MGFIYDQKLSKYSNFNLPYASSQNCDTGLILKINLLVFFLNGILINFIYRKSDTNQIEPVNVRVEPAENDSGDENRRAKQIADQNRANPNVTTP